MLASPCRTRRIVGALVQHYDADEATVHRDVISFLDVLRSEKLIRLAGPKAPK
jgi:Coenzyme PQQ synthesis protein D (PqqD)